MKRLKKPFAAILLFLGGYTLAQDLEISGTVTSKADSLPLPGVNVSVKNTTISTFTNAAGAYSLKVSGFDSVTLEFSFMGFSPATEQVSASTDSLNVSLAESPMSVSEEMVVTGFATSVKRRNLANSVATVNAEKLDRAPAPTLDSALSGKFAGVLVSQNTGAPGGGISLTLRGVSTINGASQPLYVIDGVIVSNVEVQSGVNAVTAAAAAGSRRPQDQPTNRIADLAPGDIENIEILKGPSAAALYGAKASNGVVIITTKKGKAGAAQYTVSQSYGQRSIIKKLGVREFTAQTALETYGDVGLEIFNQGQFVDYEEEIYGNEGDIFETRFSGSGGNEKTRYYMSGNALSDEGIVKRTGYEKYGIRLNVDHHFNDRFSAEISSSFTKSVSDRGLTGNDNTGTTFGVSLSSTPSFIDLRPVNGVYPINPFAQSNAVQTRDLMRNRETVDRSVIAGKLDWNVFETARQTLDFNITAGVDYFSMEHDARFPRALQFEQVSDQPGTAILGETENETSNLYLNLTHSLFTGGGISFRTTGGLQYERTDLNNVVIVGKNLIEGQFNLDNASAITVTQNRNIQKDNGYFIQEEINFNDKVFFTMGVRGDSSSANGDTDKVYTYPKTSISVRLSEYGFWEGIKSTISEFKLRGAWGQTGNLPPPFAKYTSFDSVNIAGLGGLLPNTLRGNPDIEPETSEELELGFDATLWDGRGSLEFTYFEQDITDLILFRNVPPSTGFTQEVINGGEMKTDGMELALNLNPIRKDNFNWTTGLNYYTYDSEITKLPVPSFTTGGFADFLGRYLIREGVSPTTIIGADQLPAGPERDAIEARGQVPYQPLGNETPDFQLAWDNTFSFGNFSASWLLDWKEGGDVINLTVLLTDLGGTTADYDAAQERLAGLGDTTRPFVEDGSYVRLRDIRLQYDLGKAVLNDIVYGKLSHLRFSLTGRNLKTWTDYSSYDPEVSNFGSVAIGRSVEVTPFPSSKSVYFEISVGM
ncbi:MAG: SusC/RagA family TonB-linked outer membrane protein [Acidobacteria bacterium]|nr:SusC/RagA family TonB-linked outer membrane protein [Acidobacteriota bacterium]